MPSTRRTRDRFEEWYRKPVPAAVADAEAAGVAEAVEAADAGLVADRVACPGEPAACARPDRFPDTLINADDLAGFDTIDPANACLAMPVAIFDV
jgi:hypothetical protein